jgi:hypothetical protein
MSAARLPNALRVLTAGEVFLGEPNPAASRTGAVNLHIEPDAAASPAAKEPA